MKIKTVILDDLQSHYVTSLIRTRAKLVELGELQGTNGR